MFFDIKKACDMMWKRGLLTKLHKMGVGERVLNWIKDFEEAGGIRVRIGSYLMVPYGTPQGSVISPLLFIIMINEVL